VSNFLVLVTVEREEEDDQSDLLAFMRGVLVVCCVGCFLSVEGSLEAYEDH
jgi:hypothetical protein